MAKGSRGGKRRNKRPKDKIQIGNDVIEFDGQLTYPDNDHKLTSARRAIIEAWEAKRVKNKIEYGTAVTANGQSLGERKGGKGSVSTPLWWKQTPTNVFTHLHPRESGLLGGTFSEQDLINWSRNPIWTYRAVAKEGAYSISKRPGFDSAGFRSFYSQSNQKWDSYLTKESKRLGRELQSKQINYQQYSQQFNKAFNNMLIGLHNDLLANQKNYNYNYYLEEK